MEGVLQCTLTLVLRFKIKYLRRLSFGIEVLL